MKKKLYKSILLVAIILQFSLSCYSQNKPNIVLIFPDNIGIGELSSYGGTRGVATPNIDKIGNEGIRLTNFNVEYSCTPSRIALLTGRYATRAGEDYYAGTTLWEITFAEQLKTAGYATALFGKWDLGGENWLGRRAPTDQGFDEWYGIPGTSHFSQFTAMKGFPANQEIPYIWEGIAGQVSKKVKPFDLQSRRTIDREAAEKGVKFIRKNVANKKPFFLYYPITQLHFPALPHPDKAGSTGAGDMGDAMADMDYNVGLILNELAKQGIEKNTIVIWCGDNGAELRRPWRGSSGPWRGYYNSAMEGGIRSPFVMRWPGHIKAGVVSNEIIHEVDLFTTIMAAVDMPNKNILDRALDGVNQWPFLEGKQIKSNRESTIFMNRNGNAMAVKWRNWKFWYNFKTELPDIDPDNLVRLFDLSVDPQEEIDVKDYYPWVIGIMDSIVYEYESSLIKFPRVAASANSKDPYLPPTIGSGIFKPIFSRSDRVQVTNRSAALPNPDFSGTWSTANLSTVSVINNVEKPKLATLGSGWGEKMSIQHRNNYLELERVVFVPREAQPLVTYKYALDGSSTEQNINMGRSSSRSIATTKWETNRLIITTIFQNNDIEIGKMIESKITQTVWLEAPTVAPWEPVLVVETTREGVMGGFTTTNITKYARGYR